MLLARAVSTVDGERVAFDDVWTRRRTVQIADDVEICIPCLDDLIATKRFAARPQDIEDIRLLEILRESEKEP